MCSPSGMLKDQRTAYAALPVVEYDDDAKAHERAKFNAQQGGGVVYRAAGTGSMIPTLVGGDYTIGSPVPYDDLKEGDIVNYKPKWNGGKVTVHRLVQKDKGGWIASGDNNKRSESWERVKPDNYLNKVTEIHRVKKKEQPK